MTGTAAKVFGALVARHAVGARVLLLDPTRSGGRRDDEMTDDTSAYRDGCCPVVATSGVALAKTFTCTKNPCLGTDRADEIDGRNSSETLRRRQRGRSSAKNRPTPPALGPSFSTNLAKSS